MAEREHRPRHVVMVDADDPLVEVQGEFFWLEDHERILAAQREAAYRDGYSAGWEAATRRAPTTLVVKRRRGPLARLGRSLLLAVTLFVAVGFLLSMMSR